jgi:predicted acetyltransferase
MEKFYLEKPTLERKEEALEYMNEFLEAKSKLHGSSGLERCAKGMSYEEWLDDVTKSTDEKYAKGLERVPASTYFMVREEDNKIVGIVNIRHYLDNVLKNVGGHIGGSIRPTERGKGYSKIQLYLCLLECKNLGLDKVMIDCEKTNTKSERAIKSIGGVFEREFYYQPRKQVLRNYNVDVEESINRFKDTCGKQVLKKRM